MIILFVFDNVSVKKNILQKTLVIPQIVETNHEKIKYNIWDYWVLLVLMFWFGSSMYQKVPAGYVGVATLFGEVKKEPFEEGLHVPVNPFYEWYFYDVRQKSHLEEANVPKKSRPITNKNTSKCAI